VWATAPYLHNGSVPTLLDLLRPQDERPRAFCVGSRQFDPVNVGLPTPARDQSGNPTPAAAVTCASGLTKVDARELGNSNLGHSFQGTETDKSKLPAGVLGRALTPDERAALVEYLKTL
jgi:RoxA-like, cytochrome c-like